MAHAIDLQLFCFVNEGCANPVFDIAAPFLNWLGGGYALFLIAAALLFVRNSKCRMAGILILAGLAAAYYGVYYIKGWVARPRPFLSLSGIRLLETDATGFSFPSGHAAQAFMAATVLAHFFRRRLLWFGIAAAIGFSRIYVGVHYVSDVLAGAAFGVAIGYVLTKLAITAQPDCK